MIQVAVHEADNEVSATLGHGTYKCRLLERMQEAKLYKYDTKKNIAAFVATTGTQLTLNKAQH